MVQMITIALFILLPQNAIKAIKMAQVKKKSLKKKDSVQLHYCRRSSVWR